MDMHLFLIPLIFLLSVSTQELVNYRLKLEDISVNCLGLLQHNATFKAALSSLGNTKFNLVKEAYAVNEKLPKCLLSHRDRSLSLEGVGEISKQTITNSIMFLQSEFDSNLSTFNSEKGYLKMYGTIFQRQSYIKAVVNLCRALKAEQTLTCYFVNVIKDPSVLVANPRPVPWIEIRTLSMSSSVIMEDPYPNLWKFMKQTGTAEETTLKQESTSLAQCIEDECSVSLARDELLYSQDFWEKEIQPHKLVKKSYLGDTSIAECPEEVLQLLGGARNSLSFSEIMFIIYTLHPDECSSCRNAMPELKELKENMRKNNSKFYFVDCDKQRSLCAKQNVTGFPTLLAYKVPYQADNAACPSRKPQLSVVIYHGAYLAYNLIEWYNDVNDLSIHRGEPHAFHEGCNVHITITTTESSSDGLHLDCMIAVCKELAFSECFIIQADETALLIKSVELSRRDGVSSVIYEDGVPLETSFTRTQQLHRYDGDHDYNHPDCEDNRAGCIDLLQTFIMDHSRVPVTELSPIIFHSPSSYKPLFGNLPVLVALLEHDIIITNSGFMKVLESVGVRFYKEVATSFVDVDRYPAWVHGMSPKSDTPFPEDSWVFKYPRVLLFRLDDHRRSAFLKIVGGDLTEEDVVQFVNKFLDDKKMEPCNGI
ncbi:hypothetical protein ACHWQZ_G013729 [Mnemiopsis leidyi]